MGTILCCQVSLALSSLLGNILVLQINSRSHYISIKLEMAVLKEDPMIQLPLVLFDKKIGTLYEIVFTLLESDSIVFAELVNRLYLQ